MARVTLDRLDQKLDDVISGLKEAKAVMAEHIAEDRVMYTKVDRLDQNEKRREWHIRNLWTVLLGTISAVGLVYFK
jgi:phage shock protein A